MKQINKTFGVFETKNINLESWNKKFCWRFNTRWIYFFL